MAIEEGLQVDFVYTDFSKAFDKVNHYLLMFAPPVIPFWSDSAHLQSVIVSQARSNSDIQYARQPFGSDLLHLVLVDDMVDDMNVFLPVSASQACLKIQSVH
jgi:hypothetical protein